MNVLKSQIIGAIDSVYIKELIKSSTKTILHDIFKISHFDLTNMIKSNTNISNKKTTKLSLTDPPIAIFNTIEDLVSLSIAAKLPKSQQQIKTCESNIFKSTGEFDTSLTKWYNLAPADTTWHNFKTHFTNAYNNVLKIKGKKIKNRPYLQTNMTISQLTEEFAKMCNALC